MPSATQNNPKRAKRNHQRRRNILNHNGPKVNLQLNTKPHRSPNEMLGFNQDDHPYRMCNETGIPEFLEFANSRNSYGRDGDVTYALPARSYPTRFYQHAHPTYI